MPVCMRRTDKGRVCKSTVIEQHIDEFVSFHHKAIIGSCRTCRIEDKEYKALNKEYKILQFVPLADLSLGVRQMIIEIRRLGNQ